MAATWTFALIAWNCTPISRVSKSLGSFGTTGKSGPPSTLKFPVGAAVTLTYVVRQVRTRKRMYFVWVRFAGTFVKATDGPDSTIMSGRSVSYQVMAL